MNRFSHQTIPSYSSGFLLLLLNFGLGGGEFLYPTISPGQSIQKALDSLDGRMSTLEENHYRSQEIQIRLLTIASNNTSSIKYLAQGAAYLESRISKMESSRTRFDGMADSFSSRLETLEKEMESSMNFLKTSIDKLESINKVWKNNFKIVSNTFKDLKGK